MIRQIGKGVIDAHGGRLRAVPRSNDQVRQRGDIYGRGSVLISTHAVQGRCWQCGRGDPEEVGRCFYIY